MKEQSEKLFRAIGDVGDDLIARADEPVPKKKPGRSENTRRYGSNGPRSRPAARW